jgi:metal-responsive CopG/Arc/MetJ family transcriptional regulator
MSVKTISVSLPDFLSKKLDQLCSIEERSRSYFIRKSLEKYIDDELKNAEKKPSKLKK